MRVKRESGVALLQALLLTMIVSLLALQLSLTAREQVTTAQMLESRLEADLVSHSLEVEALFNLLTMEDRAPSFAGRWQSDAETRAGRQQFVLSDGAEIIISDLSSRLPLRLPQHPLWSSTLEQVGMPRAMAEEFLNQLRDIQDEDTLNASMGAEVANTGRGVMYPNRFVQLPSELERWMGNWNGWMPLIQEVSHHYPLFEINKSALATTIANAAVNKPINQGKQAFASSTKSAALLASGDELISKGSSNYWRIDVAVEQGSVIRRARKDFLLQSLNEPPFLWVGK